MGFAYFFKKFLYLKNKKFLNNQNNIQLLHRPEPAKKFGSGSSLKVKTPAPTGSSNPALSFLKSLPQ
jgi:hypothetical protein